MFTKHSAKSKIVKRALELPLVEIPFSRRQILILQFSKLLNYFPDDLSPEWGGGYGHLSSTLPVSDALDRFLTETEASEQRVDNWIHKKYDLLPWGPDNFKLRLQPLDKLGIPAEAYLSINGGIVTINQAARLLCIVPAELVKLKLKLLLDRNVIAEAINRMLKPRPEWELVEAKKGAAAKPFRPKLT